MSIKMKLFLFCITLLLIMTNSCYCILSEYYLGDEEVENDNQTGKLLTDTRRGIVDDAAFILDHDDEYEPDFVIVPNKPIMTKTYITSTTTSKVTNYFLFNNFTTTTASKSNKFDIFEEYNYAYNEDDTEYGRNDTDTSTTVKESILTEKDKLNVIDLVSKTKKVNFTIDNTTRVDNKSIKYLADFYNLQPAVARVELTPSVLYKYKGNRQHWYIAQKFPCWELPALYAEMGRKLKKEDVHVVYAAKLKNVVEIVKDEPLPTKYYVQHTVHFTNKWCSEPPCFGDHTLCLLTGKKISSLCEKKYKVERPTISEQIALVNTLNSIRNRIANGLADKYSHLPPAANMKQIMYDYDLEEMAAAWLRQCLPGTAPCSSLNKNRVKHLECTKYAEYCCLKSVLVTKRGYTCIPRYECLIQPAVGCMYAWFWSAGTKLSRTDVECGHITSETFNTVQLLWAETNKIGCAFGLRRNGDIRIVCNFSPGAPYYMECKYFCGLIGHDRVSNHVDHGSHKVTDLEFLNSLGVKLKPVIDVGSYSKHDVKPQKKEDKDFGISLRSSDLDVFNTIYHPGWIRKKLKRYKNGTMAMTAKLVTRYSFSEEDNSKCDTNEPIYVIGEPGKLCQERGLRFSGLCYNYVDSTSTFRLCAILAPIALFILILYDLFSGVVRQTHN